MKRPVLVVLTRVRHCLTTSSKAGQRLLLAEETDAMAFSPTADEPLLVGSAAAKLVENSVAHETGPAARMRQVNFSLARLNNLRGAIERRAAERAKVLEADHIRIRNASKTGGTLRVASVSPVDIVGVYSLMPALD